MARPSLSILDVFHSESPAATEFRRILYRVMKKAPDQEHKSILITSSTLSEGKSTVSSLLSICAAKKGLKTLLIDADLRRPAIHSIFKLPSNAGLVDILADGLPAKSATMATSLDNLDIITAGRTTSHPAELFDPVAIGRLIEEAKFYYDLIVIDAAPIIPVSDPMLLAQEVDGVILVIRAGKTQKEVVDRAVDIIDRDRSRLMGVILNNVASSLPHYYDESYYGYDYTPTSGANNEPLTVDHQEKNIGKSDRSGNKNQRNHNQEDSRSSTGKIPHQK